MSSSKKSLQAQANKLRAAIAEAQAKVDDMVAKLRKIEATLTGEKAPLIGLELLWEAAPKMAKIRSSKHVCRVAWNRIPKSERPTIPDMVEAMKKWAQCDEWRKEAGQFVPALDRWISERRWEDAPEVRTGSRYSNVAKPSAAPAPAEDIVTDRAEIRRMLNLKPVTPHHADDTEEPAAS